MSDVKLNEKTVGTLKEGAWPQWSRKCKASLRAQGAWSYIEGPLVTAPTDATELVKWTTTNDRIVGAICGVVDDPLIQEIEKFTTAKTTWDYLKKKTHQGGILAKLTTLQSAIRTRFTSHSTISATIADIKDLIATVYDEGEPTKEEWTIVILLQALSDGDFDWLHKNLIGFMMGADSKLSSEDLIKRLETEAQEARSQQTLGNQRRQFTDLLVDIVTPPPLNSIMRLAPASSFFGCKKELF